MDEIQDESQSDDESFDSFAVDTVHRENADRKEATITLPVKPQNATGLRKATIKLKIDTCASGKTVPMRHIRQMYRNDRNKIKANLTQENVKLTAYNGRSIKYCGTHTGSYTDTRNGTTSSSTQSTRGTIGHQQYLVSKAAKTCESSQSTIQTASQSHSQSKTLKTSKQNSQSSSTPLVILMVK